MLASRSRSVRERSLSTLVLVPGLLCDATIWQAQIEAFGDERDIVVADLREYASIEAMARHVLEIAPPSFALAGHSMGARVALEVVRLESARVERLALLDTGTHPVRPGERQSREQLLTLARRNGMAALADTWLPPMLHPDPSRHTNVLPALRAMVERMSPAIFEDQIEALLGRPDATPVLASVRCPLLIGVGAQDRWSPPEQHEAMARSAPHAVLIKFEESGHMAPVEAPTAVSAALHSWLELPINPRKDQPE